MVKKGRPRGAVLKTEQRKREKNKGKGIKRIEEGEKNGSKRARE